MRASDATGVAFGALAETARRESGFRADAQAKTSSARGLFQFIESTWLDMVARHGAKHGFAEYAARARDPASRRDVLALRDDPAVAALMAGELARENSEALQAALGRAPSQGELYAAHVLGAGGAATLIKAAERGVGDASALFPKAAAANAALFYRDGAPVSAAALLARLTGQASISASPVAPSRLIDTPVEAEAGDWTAMVEAFIDESVASLLNPEFGDAARGALARSAYERLLERASTIP